MPWLSFVTEQWAWVPSNASGWSGYAWTGNLPITPTNSIWHYQVTINGSGAFGCAVDDGNYNVTVYTYEIIHTSNITNFEIKGTARNFCVFAICS